MAYVDVPGNAVWHPAPIITNTVPAFASVTSWSISGTTRIRQAFMLTIPKTGTLDKVEMYCGFISSPSDIKISFQDIDLATGFPDGVVDQFRVVAGGSVAVGWVVPGLITSDGTDGGVKRSVTAGQTICVVTEWDTTQSGQVWWYGLNDNSNNLATQNNVYSATHNGTSWSVSASIGAYLTIVFKYDDGTYAIPGAGSGMCVPASAWNTRSYGTGSTPDERGMRFSFPYGCKVNECFVNIDMNADFDVVLYDTDGTTPLATVSWDANQQISAVGSRNYFRLPDVPLTANGVYRLVVKPTTATTISIYELTVPSVAIMGAYGYAPGANFYLTTRTDAGAWTDTTTQRPWMGIKVSQIDFPAGGGGATSAAYIG